eukprot:CAMPEP_0170060140 /NCGR_PEP_ID=MMETSP0019_2-20121128/2173_1 /TAXON_ID=98059 /ORGANISM="Dinobryon sp., Strain UTEXLB2267" /LENGTH=125 /DNA_ID=CAMNT_0010265603 /DNA_START=26 /DNA_END=403 /DNA_ORIENTATION=-
MELLFCPTQTEFHEDDYNHGATIEPECPGSPIISDDYDSDNDDRFSVVRDSLKLVKRKQANEFFEDFYFSHVEHALSKISRPKAMTSEFTRSKDEFSTSAEEILTLKSPPSEDSFIGSLKKSKRT